MLALIGGLRAVSTAGSATRSIRIRSSASAYLSKGVVGVSTEKLWTYSIWVKRSKLNSNQHLYSGAASSASYSALYFNASNQLVYQQADAGVIAFDVTTSQVFRDTSSWYHIVLVYDTAQATASNRVKIYVNGNQVTSFSSAIYPSLNLGSYITNPGAPLGTTIGRYAGVGIEYFDGYLSEIIFVTNQALTPSSFGQISLTAGVWSPKRYTGACGTNGFYLRFADPSTATATAIGKDTSGNNNNWTPNNISVTAGVTYDSMLDVPTNNYCTFNLLDKITTAALVSGNLETTSVASQDAVGNISMNSGSWYWEISYSAATASQLVGVYKTTATTVSVTPTTAVIGVTFNAGTGELNYTTDGINYTSIATGLTGGGYFPYAGSLTGAKIIYANFGQRPFAYIQPVGFFALNASNITAPAVVNGASVMAATTYTGSGIARSLSNAVNSVSFQPGLVWIKGRSGATDHALYDVVRGTTKDLVSNSTAVETTQATGLTAFNADGFGIGALAKLNTSAATYIAWQWKAGGTAVSNTAGTITSQVSANTAAGFSVVTYTGTGANATVGHGLGVAPSFIIIKNTATIATNWIVYSSKLTATNYLTLNLTDSSTASIGIFNNTEPTSSLFSVGTAVATNNSLDKIVAYCFAEIAGFSKFGSYTGNGAADGPFVYCGFKPRFIMVKASSTTGDWAMIDTTRSTFNVAGITSSANTAAAEAALLSIDILANGFKIRSATLNNTSAATYIFAAWAENSIKYALAR